jgi:NitT/TauT family transport system ATP-binding protein
MRRPESILLRSESGGGCSAQRVPIPFVRFRSENRVHAVQLAGHVTVRTLDDAAAFTRNYKTAEFGQHYPKQLSGGMQQRTAIARALANDPAIPLLDEPFGALDNQTRALMQELLLGIWERERKTVLFVTHDIEEAIFLASRVVVMTARPGRIKADVPIELPHPRHYTIKTSSEFSALKARLTEEIRVEAIVAAAAQ